MTKYYIVHCSVCGGYIEVELCSSNTVCKQCGAIIAMNDNKITTYMARLPDETHHDE